MLDETETIFVQNDKLSDVQYPLQWERNFLDRLFRIKPYTKTSLYHWPVKSNHAFVRNPGNGYL